MKRSEPFLATARFWPIAASHEREPLAKRCYPLQFSLL